MFNNNHHSPLSVISRPSTNGKNEENLTAMTTATTTATKHDDSTKDVFVLPKLIYDSVRFKYLRIGELLGKGGFASCYTATDCGDGQKFALKIIPKTRLLKEKETRKIMYEIHVQFALVHPYIVKMFSAFDDNCNVYMLLEHCQKRSMNVFLSRRPGNKIGEKSAQHFMRQIIQGVQFLHDEVKILHRDLKLGNLLLSDEVCYFYDDFKQQDENKNILQRSSAFGHQSYQYLMDYYGNRKFDDLQDRQKIDRQIYDDPDFGECRFLTVKICDFGLAAPLDDNNNRENRECQFRRRNGKYHTSDNGYSSSTIFQNGCVSCDETDPGMCGTPNYIAPEVLRREGHSTASDAWSVGCIMYAILFGKPPFETSDINRTYHLILSNKYNLFDNKIQESHQVDLNVDRISNRARSLIALFLHQQPSHRPRFNRNLFQHPFFTA